MRNGNKGKWFTQEHSYGDSWCRHNSRSQKKNMNAFRTATATKQSNRYQYVNRAQFYETIFIVGFYAKKEGRYCVFRGLLSRSNLLSPSFCAYESLSGSILFVVHTIFARFHFLLLFSSVHQHLFALSEQTYMNSMILLKTEKKIH